MSEKEGILKVIAPVFWVRDLQASLAFYRDVLNFSIGFEWQDEPDEPVRYAIIQSGDCEIHLSQCESEDNSTAYIFVEGLAAYYEAVKGNGLTQMDPLKDYPWGMREFEVTDPDGHRLIFGEHLSRIEEEHSA